MRYNRYIATCENCDFETNSYLTKAIPEAFAEEHMMKTGHCVCVVESKPLCL